MSSNYVDWTGLVNTTALKGKLTKNNGGNAWNGGAKTTTQYDGNADVFFQVIADAPKNIAFGFTEASNPDTSDNAIFYRFELKNDYSYSVYNQGYLFLTGTYADYDVFKVELKNGVISFYINNVFKVQNTFNISFPVYIDGAIYTQGDYFTASLNGELEEVYSGGSLKARYIRDHLNGSDVNEYSHFIEIQAYSDGVNVALGKPVTSDSPGKDKPSSVITDGDTSNMNLFFEPQINKAWVQVDLGNPYSLEKIVTFHYIGRKYHETKTQVSIDRISWITIFDSAIDGEYMESSTGNSILLASDPVFVEKNILLGLDQALVRSDVVSLNFDQKLIKSDQILLNIDQEISKIDQISLELNQELSRLDRALLNMDQRIGKRDRVSLNFDQNLINFDQISIDFDQKISKSDQISINFDQEISKLDQVSLDFDQEISKLDQAMIDFDQAISKSDQISLELDQTLVRSSRVLLKLNQKLGLPESIELYFDQNITKSDQISLELNQEFSIESHQFLDIRPSIYDTNSSILDLEIQHFEDRAESLSLDQTIYQDKKISLNLNQNILFGDNRIASLYLDQDIYLNGQSILELEQESSLDGEIALSIFIEYVTPVIGEIDLPIVIQFVDYGNALPIIGRIQLKGKREPYAYLKGNRDLFLYGKGGISLTILNQDFSMFSGDTKILVVTIDEPIDFGGVDIEWGIRKTRVTGENIIVKTLTNGITIEDSEIHVKLESKDTQDLTGEYIHEMELTDNFENVSTLFVGKMRIEKSGI